MIFINALSVGWAESPRAVTEESPPPPSAPTPAPGSEGGAPSSCPRRPTQPLSLRPHSLSHACGPLGFISMYFAHLLLRCGLRYQKNPRERLFWGTGNAKKICFPYKFMAVPSLLYVILAYERFHRKVLFSVAGGACIWKVTCQDTCSMVFGASAK